MIEFPGRYKALVLSYVTQVMTEYCDKNNMMFMQSENVQRFIKAFEKEQNKIIETEEGQYWDGIAHAWVSSVVSDIILAVELASDESSIASQQMMLGLLKPYSGFIDGGIRYTANDDVRSCSVHDDEDGGFVPVMEQRQEEVAPSIEETNTVHKEPKKEPTMKTKRTVPSYIGTGAWLLMGLNANRVHFNLAVDVVVKGLDDWKRERPNDWEELKQTFDPATMQFLKKMTKDGTADKLIEWLWSSARGNPFRRNLKVSLGLHGPGYLMEKGLDKEALPMALINAAIFNDETISYQTQEKAKAAANAVAELIQMVFVPIIESGEEGVRIGDVLRSLNYDLFGPGTYKAA